MTKAHNIKLLGLNTLENQETMYGNHALFDINAQNNTIAIPGRAEAKNNTTAISCCAKPNQVDIECKLKELLKFEY